MADPLDEYLLDKTAADVGRKDKEIQLLQQWKASGNKPEHLEPLLDMYSPLIKRKASEYGRGLAQINPATMEAEVTKHVINAFHSYDPDKGTALITHVYNRVPKTLRFVAANQNIAKIPENKIFSKGVGISNLRKATDQLTEDLGRDPTDDEIAAHMNAPVKKVTDLKKRMIRDVPQSVYQDSQDQALGQARQEVLSLLPEVLTPQEKQVFELVYHPHNPVRDSTGIANKLGLQIHQVSRLKTSILNKLRENE